MKELFEIQQEIQVPKKRYNKFGKFWFRNSADIMEALKPLLKKYKVRIKSFSAVAQIGDRFYVKVTVSMINEKGEEVSSVGYAREQESRKGMDAAQLTGSATTYAFRYAIDGLLFLHEGDPDEIEDTAPPVQHNNKHINKPDLIYRELVDMIGKGIIESGEISNTIHRMFGEKKSYMGLTEDQRKQLLQEIKGKEAKKNVSKKSNKPKTSKISKGSDKQES